MIFDVKTGSAPHIYALPPGRPFFDDLVRAILADYGDDLSALTAIRIFVPSKRAVRSLKESFARHAPRGVMLLPRITATADLSEDDPHILALGVGAVGAAAPSPAVKRLKIAGIYSRAMVAREDPVTWYGALRGASELVRTSDQLTEYSVSAEALRSLPEAEALEGGAEHWREVSSLLSLVSEQYPAWLAEQGLVDLRERRAHLLRQLSEALASGDQHGLILAAGFMGTSPSSQDFLAKVASLPNGAVVVPGLDAAMSDAAWDAIEAPHPQASYKEFFEKALDGFARSEARPLPFDEGAAGTARRELLSLALTPAEATGDWARELETYRGHHDADDALDGLSYAVARTSEEEADFIALALRETLETPGKTAAFVSADRELARRVAAKLRGWGIEIDDSGGAPIRGSYRGTFLRLIAQVMADPSDPVALSGLVHHQLFGLGLSAEERRPLVQAFDRFLRGRKPRPGWDGLAQSLDDDWRPYRPQQNETDRALAREMVSRLRKIVREAMPEGVRSVHDLLVAHLKIAEAFAATDTEAGADRLYRFEDGEVLEPHLQSLLQHPELLGEAPLGEYPDVFEALLEGPTFRPPGGQHPRLALYGVLEARLQTADLFVVGGLQEGVWPGDAVVDPFLSRAMRKALGLPSPDADIGRVAQDFFDFASQPEVLLTRSARRGTSPARASRLMLRLESFLKKLDPKGAHDASERLRGWRKVRFGGEGVPEPARPPLPVPAKSAKPTHLSVSDIATWLRDPYAIFGKHVLRLRPMRAYDESFGPSHRGDMVHRWLEEFGRLQLDEPIADVAGQLDAMLPDAMDAVDMPADQRQLNRRFVERAAEAFAHFQGEASALSQMVALETSAKLEISFGEMRVRVRGIADRVDRFGDGGVHIIDYKLGGATTVQQGAAFSPQLFLLALMMERGGFDEIATAEVRQISYLPLNSVTSLFSGKDESRRYLRGSALREALKGQEASFFDWLQEQYADGATFPSQVYPYRSDSVGDYDDLARRSEWVTGGSDE